MQAEDVRYYALSLPEAEEAMPFGTEVLAFKIKGKIFCLLNLETEKVRMNVKCDPDEAVELRERYPAVVPGWHMNKKHWNTLIMDGNLSPAFIKKQIEKSYLLVKPKK